MGSDPACLDRTHRHVVTARNRNYSSFNGYSYTYSQWSEVRCLATGQFWRTKANYVDSLPSATIDEASRPI